MGWLLALTLVLLLMVVGSRLLRSITILEYERALRFENGQFVAVAGPGKYWYLPHRTRFQPVDTRLVHEAVSGQEVLSSDAVAFKASLLASYRIVDPKLAVLETQNVQERFAQPCNWDFAPSCERAHLRGTAATARGGIRPAAWGGRAAPRKGWCRAGTGRATRSHAPWRPEESLLSGGSSPARGSGGPGTRSWRDCGSPQPGQRGSGDRASPEPFAASTPADHHRALRKHSCGRKSSQPRSHLSDPTGLRTSRRACGRVGAHLQSAINLCHSPSATALMSPTRREVLAQLVGVTPCSFS